VAQSPALGAHAGRLYAAFVTLALSFDAPGAQLHVAEVGGHARFRLPIRHHDATPQLTSGARALLISYRDRPTPAARIEHFVLALGPELAPAGAARRIGRASGARGPTLSQCGVSTYSAVPIEHGSELYVIFHALDAELAPREANHQCYATERSFVAAATACDGAGVYALVAEASDPSGAPAELLGMRYACSSAP